MRLLNKLLDKMMARYLEKNEDRLLYAMEKVNEGGTLDDVDTVAEDYFYLLKTILKKKKPIHVELDPEYHYLVIVDGEPYDFDDYFHHGFGRNNERKMEIDVLMGNNIPHELVQMRLNKKIETDW